MVVISSTPVSAKVSSGAHSYRLDATSTIGNGSYSGLKKMILLR